MHHCPHQLGNRLWELRVPHPPPPLSLSLLVYGHGMADTLVGWYMIRGFFRVPFLWTNFPSEIYEIIEIEIKFGDRRLFLKDI